MKERPILFSGPMVRAILEGRKTQTRRLAKFSPLDGCNFGFSGLQAGHYCTGAPTSGWVLRSRGGACWNDRTERLYCPYGVPGDRLWVRETWCPVDDDGAAWVDYRATPRYSAEHPAGWENAPGDAEALKWRPSIHMPRWASRITLEVTEVRAQRLQEISEEDARAEGVAGLLEQGYAFRDGPREDFGALWRRIYGPASWDANPWVWAVSFKVIAASARARRAAGVEARSEVSP